MPRLGAKVNSGDFLTEQDNGVTLTLKVQPRASRNEIGPPQAGALRVRVTAPPVDSAANEAVLELIADWLGCRRGAVQLLRGQTSRQKVVRVQGVTAEFVRRKLAAPG